MAPCHSGKYFAPATAPGPQPPAAVGAPGDPGAGASTRHPPSSLRASAAFLSANGTAWSPAPIRDGPGVPGVRSGCLSRVGFGGRTLHVQPRAPSVWLWGRPGPRRWLELCQGWVRPRLPRPGQSHPWGFCTKELWERGGGQADSGSPPFPAAPPGRKFGVWWNFPWGKPAGSRGRARYGLGWRRGPLPPGHPRVTAGGSVGPPARGRRDVSGSLVPTVPAGSVPPLSPRQILSRAGFPRAVGQPRGHALRCPPHPMPTLPCGETEAPATGDSRGHHQPRPAPTAPTVEPPPGGERVKEPLQARAPLSGSPKLPEGSLSTASAPLPGG